MTQMRIIGTQQEQHFHRRACSKIWPAGGSIVALLCENEERTAFNAGQDGRPRSSKHHKLTPVEEYV